MPREIAIQQQSGVSEMDVIARRIAESRMFGLDPAQAFTLCLLAESEGLPPIQAVRRFHVINGRPSMRADAMQAEFQRHGGTVEWVISTAEECEAIFRHEKHAPKGLTIRTTLKELIDRGVAKNPTYRTYPRQMLRARVISEGVRAVDPGIVVGIYTPEEVAEFDPPAKVINVKPAAQRWVGDPDLDVQEAAQQAEVIGDALVQQLDAPQTPREKARRRQEERYPEPRGNPRDRHPDPADVAAALDQHDARTYQEVISDVVRGADAEWAELARKLDIEPDPKDPVVNAFQVENHITTWALGAGVLKPEHVETDGKRDRKKMVDALAKLHRRNPDRFVGLVASYVAEKLAERTKAAEAAVYGEPEPSQEPATPAEDVSQDVVEEVHGEGDDRVVIERREVAHA